MEAFLNLYQNVKPTQTKEYLARYVFSTSAKPMPYENSSILVAQVFAIVLGPRLVALFGVTACLCFVFPDRQC
jgi:hypothetical protein